MWKTTDEFCHSESTFSKGNKYIHPCKKQVALGFKLLIPTALSIFSGTAVCDVKYDEQLSKDLNRSCDLCVPVIHVILQGLLTFVKIN